jgi:hypothetical protein
MLIISKSGMTPFTMFPFTNCTDASGTELADSANLLESGVTNGTNLQLVLALRGGPINMRRIPAETNGNDAHAVRRFTAAKGKHGDHNDNDQQQVTVLLLRDGDQINVYHVSDVSASGAAAPGSAGSTGRTFSPALSESWSLRNLFSSAGAHEADPEAVARLRDNAVTMNKMVDLRSQLESLSMKRKQKVGHLPYV